VREGDGELTMNEIIHGGLKLSVPTIIQVNISPDLAYKLKRMLESHSEKTNHPLSAHIAHKLWIALYHAKFSQTPSFICLTRHWQEFCHQFVLEQLNHEPSDKNLAKILHCICAGQEVRSE
jgi:hypothetical protein